MLLRRPISLCLVCILGILLFPGMTLCQDEIKTQPLLNAEPFKVLYIHGGVGLGFDVYTSSQIESILPDGFKIGILGIPRSYSCRIGYRLIAQLEYRKIIANHTIRKNDFVGGGGSGIGTVAETKMNYRSSEWLIKVNPMFHSKLSNNKNDPSQAKYSGFFLLFGTSKVTYRDKVDDGWEGKGLIYGIEHITAKKNYSTSISATWHSINYNKITLFSLPINSSFDAGQFMIFGSISLGFGY